MQPTGRYILTAVVIVAGTVSAAHAKEHMAAHSEDGHYAVHITTHHGSCGEHNWRIVVSGVRITAAGHTPVTASGHVDHNGHVSLTFHRLWHVAKATGRLRAGTGSGTWTLPSMQCGGSWRAARHI